MEIHDGLHGIDGIDDKKILAFESKIEGPK